MNQLEIALLKDKILTYLAKRANQYIDLDVLIKDLKLANISKSVLNGYMNEMSLQGTIDYAATKDSGSARITDEGEKLLSEGGFSEIAKQNEQDRITAKEKTRLEIQNLKLTRWLSIIAIIISVLAIIISIIKQ